MRKQIHLDAILDGAVDWCLSADAQAYLYSSFTNEGVTEKESTVEENSKTECSSPVKAQVDTPYTKEQPKGRTTATTAKLAGW